MEIDLGRRLRALGRAHELVRPSLGHQRKAALLGELLAVLLAAYDEKGVIGDRIKVASPEVMIGEASTTTMALVIHELATNSLKYGALSVNQGALNIDCTPMENQVVVRWVESGGPPVVRPEGMSGFGSKLVHRSIVDQLGGSIVFDWLSQGVVVTLEVNRARLGT
jgi:two-component sensor histidine kinase